MPSKKRQPEPRCLRQIKRKPEIGNVRKAGDNHRVVEILGGTGAYCKRPCPTCPWRKDATGEFPAEAFKHSANTAYDMSTHKFGCHSTGTKHPATCAGFLLKGAAHNLSVRMGVMKGEINLDDVSDGGVELYDSYRDMAVGNGVDPAAPVLLPCRSNDE